MGIVAFFIPLAISLWSIELSAYLTLGVLSLSLVRVLKPLAEIAVGSGWCVIWYEFSRATFAAFPKPHSIFAYAFLIGISL